VIDCHEFGGITADLSPSVGFFAQQSYSFLLDCPPGYLCFPGFYPIVITIPPIDIPPVTQTGDRFSIYGCQGMVSAPIPFGISVFATQQIVNGLFAQWAFQEAQCRLKKSPAPGIPPPTLIPTGKKRTDVGNTPQSFTAHCTPDNAGTPKTATQAAGTITETLFNATPDQIAEAQARVNAVALDQATKDANSQLLCGVCNVEAAGTAECPGFPGISSHLVIPAGKYCQIGGIQGQQDAKAQADLINGLASLQQGLGCICRTTVNNTARTLSVTCPATIFLVTQNGSIIPPPSLFSFGPADSPVDLTTYVSIILTGNVVVIPQSYTGPNLHFYYP
jgi:hypothetical protein